MFSYVEELNDLAELDFGQSQSIGELRDIQVRYYNPNPLESLGTSKKDITIPIHWRAKGHPSKILQSKSIGELRDIQVRYYNPNPLDS